MQLFFFLIKISTPERKYFRKDYRKTNKGQIITMDAKLEFVTVGANRFAECAAWNSKYEILAYGGGSLINIWSPLVCRINYK